MHRCTVWLFLIVCEPITFVGGGCCAKGFWRMLPNPCNMMRKTVQTVIQERYWIIWFSPSCVTTGTRKRPRPGKVTFPMKRMEPSITRGHRSSQRLSRIHCCLHLHCALCIVFVKGLNPCVDLFRVESSINTPVRRCSRQSFIERAKDKN